MADRDWRVEQAPEHAFAKMIGQMVTRPAGEPTSGCAASFLISEHPVNLADERRARRYWPSGLPLHTHVIWPLAARWPRDFERAVACGTRGRTARLSPGASGAAKFALGRRAARLLNEPPIAAAPALAVTRRRALFVSACTLSPAREGFSDAYKRYHSEIYTTHHIHTHDSRAERMLAHALPHAHAVALVGVAPRLAEKHAVARHRALL